MANEVEVGIGGNRRVTRHMLGLFVSVLLAGTALAGVSLASSPASARASGDAYVTFDPASSTWSLGTAAVQRKLQLAGGHFLMTSFLNKALGTDYVQGTSPSDEFAIQVGATTYTGATDGWLLDSWSSTTLSQGELQVTIQLHDDVLTVQRIYVVYPSTGVILDWSTYTNRTSAAISVSSPAMFRNRLMSSDVGNVDFAYMTGGADFTGSQVFTPLTPSARGGSNYTRTFDSYDPVAQVPMDGKTGEGTRADGTPYVMGSAVYNQIFTLRNSVTGGGVFQTWNYAGHWSAQTGNVGGNFLLDGRVSMSNRQLTPSSSLVTPKAMMGVFTGDYDDMGNAILDYVYRYKWDYTRDNEFGKISVSQWLGRYTSPKVPETPVAFSAINAARYIGADRLWIDDNWMDARGSWDNMFGDDFKAINDYASTNGMTFTAWYPTWNAAAASKVLVAHPEYEVPNDSASYYGLHVDASNPAARQWQLDLLKQEQQAWGDHMWRYDGDAVWPSGTNDNSILDQSNGWFALLQQFKDANPNAGIFGCSSGGELISIEATRFSDVQQATDGYQMHYDGYWSSLITAPDKLHAGSAFDDLNADLTKPYQPNMRGLLRGPFLYQSDNLASAPAADLELRRKDVELYHYFEKAGVAGRWVKVYRPTASAGVDPTYYLQKMSADQTKGYITVYENASTLAAPGQGTVVGQNVTLYPKGLIPTQTYTIATLAGGMPTTTQTGAQWMASGIPLAPLKVGELIFINLEQRPGAGTDTTAPTAPSGATKHLEYRLTRGGVALNWQPGADDNWVSYYEIFRNGVSIDKVSKGTYYFDIAGSIDDTYEVRTVDGDGNVSGKAAAVDNSTASEMRAAFSSVQGRNGWSYETFDGTNYTPMTWDATNWQWKGAGQYNLVLPQGALHPDAAASDLAWQAPRAGNVRISGTVAKSVAGGDGVRARITKNGVQVWPTYPGQQVIAGVDTVGYAHDFTLAVAAGDRIRFEIDNGGAGNTAYDQTSWDPVIQYDGTVVGAPATIPQYSMAGDYSWLQGAKGWSYVSSAATADTAMTFTPNDYHWQGTPTYVDAYSPDLMHPDIAVDAVKVWTAAKPGKVTIAGTVAKADVGGGDGVQARILKNGVQIWPASGWQQIAYNDRVGASYSIPTTVAQGDTIRFVLNAGPAANRDFDLTKWDSTITYDGWSSRDLLGLWTFDEGTGSTAADTSWSGNTATLVNSPAWVSGHSGAALGFNGGSAYAQLPASAALNGVQSGDYTLSAWYDPATVPTGSGTDNNAAQGIVIKAGYHIGLIYDGAQRFRFFHDLTNAELDATSTGPYAPGTWHFLTGVVSRTNGTVSLYVDGALQATTSFTPGAAARDYGTTPWTFGVASPGAATYAWPANGSLDQVRIFQSALSGAEVQSLYANGG